MNKKFDRIVIGIAIIVFAITPAVYSLDIRVLWAVILDLGEISIVAIASVFTGFLSLLIAGFSLWLSKRADERNDKQVRLSVRPFLSTTVESFPEDNEGITMKHRVFKIANKGIGPAVITDIKLFFNGDPVLYSNHEDCGKVLNKIILGDSIDKNTILEFTSIAPGSIIAIGEEEVMWSIKFDSKTEYSKIVDNFDNIKIRIEYESMYKEKIHPPIDTRIERKFS